MPKRVTVSMPSSQSATQSKTVIVTDSETGETEEVQLVVPKPLTVTGVAKALDDYLEAQTGEKSRTIAETGLVMETTDLFGFVARQRVASGKVMLMIVVRR